MIEDSMWHAWRRKEIYTGSWLKDLKEKDCMKGLSVDGRKM